jgi:hypothetical protein
MKIETTFSTTCLSQESRALMAKNLSAMLPIHLKDKSLDQAQITKAVNQG